MIVGCSDCPILFEDVLHQTRMHAQDIFTTPTVEGMERFFFGFGLSLMFPWQSIRMEKDFPLTIALGSSTRGR